MSFFGLGPGELVVIAVLALIVVGPQQLPALLKQMGSWFGKAREMQRELQRGVDDIVRESELDGVAKTVSKVRNFSPAGAATEFLNKEFEDPNASASSGQGQQSNVGFDDLPAAPIAPVSAPAPASDGTTAGAKVPEKKGE